MRNAELCSAYLQSLPLGPLPCHSLLESISLSRGLGCSSVLCARMHMPFSSFAWWAGSVCSLSCCWENGRPVMKWKYTPHPPSHKREQQSRAPHLQHPSGKAPYSSEVTMRSVPEEVPSHLSLYAHLLDDDNRGCFSQMWKFQDLRYSVYISQNYQVFLWPSSWGSSEVCIFYMGRIEVVLPSV